MKRIAVVTRDEFLYKKIALSLEGCDTVMLGSGDGTHGFDRVFADIDTCEFTDGTAVTMSRRGECDLSIPFGIDAPARYLTDTAEARLLPESREVALGDRLVKLTELEFALFSLIVEACGEPVSREKILERVWHGETDGGIVNVYIHYLREKLEDCGERVIVASRGRGYSLSEKYVKMFGERREV